MSTFSTTKLSTKGQVVIPEEIRIVMGLQPGTRFLVMAENDVVVLKAISEPSKEDSQHLIQRAREEAAAIGLQESDFKDAVLSARGKS